MTRLKLSNLILVIAAVIGLPSGATAIVLSDREQDHVITPGEPMYGLNLDGVAAVGSGTPGASSLAEIIVFQCSGALIGDRHVLTAAHCLDTDKDGAVDFLTRSFPYVAGFELPDHDVLLEVNTSTVHWPAFWPEGDTDIAVLELLESAPPEIPRYRLYGGRDEIGWSTVLAGYGATGYGDTGIDGVPSAGSVKRAGLNRLESLFDHREVEIGFDFDSGDPAHNALNFIGEISDLGFGADEVLSSQGDSGGPVFIDGAIAGVIAFNTNLIAADYNDQFDQSWGEAGFATRVSSFQDFITAATGGAAVFVTDSPHPGDYNASGMVEQADLELVLLNWGSTNVPSTWTQHLPIGLIDQQELDGVLLNWGATRSSAMAAAVPEPATWALVLFALIGVAAQRGRESFFSRP